MDSPAGRRIDEKSSGAVRTAAAGQTPRVGAGKERGMLCKWCGMESVTTDQCSWCHRSFVSSPKRGSDRRLPEAMRGGAREASVEDAEVTDALIAEEQEAEATSPIFQNSPSAVPEPQLAAGAPPLSVPISAEDEAASMADTPIIPIRRGPRTPAPGVAPLPGSRANRPPAPAIVPPAASRVAAAARNRQPTLSTHGGAPHPHPAVPEAASASRTLNDSPAAVPADPSSLNLRSAPGAARPVEEEAEAPGLAEGVSASMAAASEAENLKVPKVGAFRPAQSKYYSGQVIDAASGTHYDSESGKPTAAPLTAAERLRLEAADVGPTLGFLVMRFVAVLVLIAMGTFALVHARPSATVLMIIVSEFALGMLMPIMRAAPWQDDDSDDVIVFVILTLVFGPFISLIMYAAWCAMRQDFSPAMVGLLLIAATCRLAVEAGAGTLLSMQMMPWALGHFSPRLMFMGWAGLVGLAGWYAANMFHRLDE